MSDEYNPPFQVTEMITNLTIEIGQYVGSITAFEKIHPNPVLRRENRIRSIHSSLAIEQNTLTLEQVTDVIDGKRVLGPPQDIREVKNAYEVYDVVASFDPYSVKDLLHAHRIMMNGLVKEAGVFRSGNVGVYAGTQLIHAGTPAKYVPELMEQLFSWLKKSKYHPLIKSCVFHYEFEFIHPFADGNGRMGRLWQSLILQKWQPIFAWLPIETLVHENQEEYYRVLQLADNAGESTVFVEFLLRMIRDALKEMSKTQNDRQNVGTNVGVNVGTNVGTNEEKILLLLKQDGTLTAKMLAGTLGITQRQVERMIAKLKSEGLLVRHGASKNGFWEVLNH
ncbi:MAG: Fic family protein [Lachnospiraceae bacterium]|nr:Fic family protein [Lachnospiraceae bacterium]MDY2760368.1 Fic family protein [Lachnospiraceae bacterium]